MPNQTIRVLFLCGDPHIREFVLAVLLDANEPSFDVIFAENLTDFYSKAHESKVEIGLLDLSWLSKEDNRFSSEIVDWTPGFPLVLLVPGGNKDGKKSYPSWIKNIKKQFLLSKEELHKLPNSLRLEVSAGGDKKDGGGEESKGTHLDDANIDQELINILQYSVVGLLRVGLGGDILFANKTLIDLLGYENLDELKSRYKTQKSTGEYRQRMEFYKILDSRGEICGHESTWTRKDGSLIRLRENARAVKDANNVTLYYDSVIEDITRLEESSSSLEKQISDMRVLTDIGGNIFTATRESDILNLVCQGTASLLKSSMAFIISGTDGRWDLDSSFGVQFPERLAFELKGLPGGAQPFAPVSYALDDFSEPPLFIPQTVILEGIHSLLVEPINAGQRVNKVLFVADRNSRLWSEDDKDLLKALIGQAAIALEKVRLLSDAEHRADDFALLYEASTSMSSGRDLRTTLSSMIESISRIMHVSDVFIYLYNEKTNALNLTISRARVLSDGYLVNMGEGFAGWVASTRKSQWRDSQRTVDERGKAMDVLPYSSVLEVPMLFGGTLIGVLGVGEIQDGTSIFSEQDVRLLLLFAAQAASAVYNINLFETIQNSNQTLDRLNRALNALIDAVSSNTVELAEKITQIVVSEFQQANCSLWLFDKDKDLLQRVSISGDKSSEFILKPLSSHGAGLIPRAVREGATINVTDVLLEPDYLAGWSSARSELVLPLKSGEDVLGVLDLQSDQPNAFHEDDARILGQFAGRASMMLEHIRLVAETQQVLLRLSAMHTVDIAVASSLDLQVTLNVFLEQVSSQLAVDAADILLLNPSLQILEYAAGRGFRATGIRRFNLRVGEDPAGRSALERMVVGISKIDTADFKISHPERIAGEGFESIYAVPLIARGKLKGVLELYFRNQFTGDVEWKNFVETLAHQAAIAIDDAHLFEQLQQSYTDLAVAYNSTIQGWAHLLELRKVEPDGHCHAVSAMSVELAGILRVPEHEMMQLYRGALLHDIGKLAIPDGILLKPGKLTEDEWTIVRTHPVLARDLLVSIDYLRSAAVIPYAHHEKWDGSGYPLGLAGGRIPLAARIFSVVDVWDSLRRDQPYRTGWNEWRATEYIQSRSGEDFDPAIVDAFLNLIRDGRNRAIADREDAL